MAKKQYFVKVYISHVNQDGNYTYYVKHCPGVYVFKRGYLLFKQRPPQIHIYHLILLGLRQVEICSNSYIPPIKLRNNFISVYMTSKHCKNFVKYRHLCKRKWNLLVRP